MPTVLNEDTNNRIVYFELVLVKHTYRCQCYVFSLRFDKNYGFIPKLRLKKQY